MLPPEQARKLLAASPRPAFTPNTVTGLSQLMDMLADAREQGYAYANGEYYRGDLNVAVPVFDKRGRPAAALNFSAPTTRWTPTRMTRALMPNLLATSRLLSPTHPTPRVPAPLRLGYTAKRPMPQP